jgi:hypothetical protein
MKHFYQLGFSFVITSLSLTGCGPAGVPTGSPPPGSEAPAPAGTTPATQTPTAPAGSTPAAGIPATPVAPAVAPTVAPLAPAAPPVAMQPPAAPPAVGPAANPNHLVNFGKPDPTVVVDPSAKSGFVASQIYAESDNGYPDCESPAQVDYGTTTVASCPAILGTRVPEQSHCHMNFNFPVTWYQTNPPSSGDHWPQASHALGINSAANAVPREYYVHSMEHGAVILAYNCPNGCDYEIGVMAQAVQARSDRTLKVLMTPDSRMPANSFAAISWNWLYLMSEPSLPNLLCFIDQHNNHARENDKVL